MPFLSAVALLTAAAIPSSAVDWSRFRGPNGAGVVETTGLPTEFGPDKNVVWKTVLPTGKSSPVLTDDRIFLTGHEDGKLYTLCLDRASGKILWRREAPGRRLEKMHRLNDEASPSPVTDGKNVYVFFAGYGMLSYGPDGNEHWRKAMGPFTNFHGMGASPILADGKLLMVVDQDIKAFAIALNVEDGSVAWRTERPDMVHSFSTPVVYRPKDRGTELIVPGSYQMVSYEVATGKEVWRIRGLTYQVKSVPVIEGDTLYFNGWAPGGEPAVRLVLPNFPEMLERFDADKDAHLSKAEIPKKWHPGNWDMQDLNKDTVFDARDWKYYQSRRTSSNATMAVKLGGRGDITQTHVLWRHRKSLPDVPSVLLYRDVLYEIKKGGIALTLNPKTGAVIKMGRLMEALDDYYASPVAADGKVYMTSMLGKMTVLTAAGEWEIIATSDLGEDVFATPAIADGRMYVRTSSTLYCFGKSD
jgi:hypothetical protein